MEFKPGDIVYLKSGGPRMTVSKIESTGRVMCVWFKDGERRSEAFAAATLRPKTDADSDPGIIA